jgi:exopolysaccharide biosynthesis polyprenyl glycosylphosphotransferase
VVSAGAAELRRWRGGYARRLAITDVIIVIGVVLMAHVLRYGFAGTLVVPLDGSDQVQIPYPVVSVLLVAAWLAVLRISGSRAPQIIGAGPAEYARVTSASVYVFGMLAVLSLILKVQPGRVYVALAFPSGVLLLLLSRWLWRQWLVRKRRNGACMRRALLVGDRTKSEHVARQMLRDTACGFSIIGAHVGRLREARDLVEGVPIIVDGDDPVDVAERLGADTVIFTGSDAFGPRDLRELGWDLESRSMELVVVPALTDIAGPRIHTRPVAGLPLIHIDFPAFESGKKVAKRVFDLIVGGIMMVVLAPAALGIAIAIRVSSRGPVFYRQERVGLNGQRFKMLKFRSMVVDAEAQLRSLLDQSDGNGMLFKMKDDPRVTRVGALLRRHSLDELPQLINVLRGQMSMVGPRPPLVSEVKRYDEWAHRRLLVKPGITGLWQTSGRSDLTWEDSIRLDLYYVENWSISGDLVLLYRTFRAVLAPAGAY